MGREHVTLKEKNIKAHNFMNIVHFVKKNYQIYLNYLRNLFHLLYHLKYTFKFKVIL
jgi:hypothetical protein